jgi:hypothetical protein
LRERLPDRVNFSEFCRPVCGIWPLLIRIGDIAPFLCLLIRNHGCRGTFWNVVTGICEFCGTFALRGGNYEWCAAFTISGQQWRKLSGIWHCCLAIVKAV